MIATRDHKGVTKKVILLLCLRIVPAFVFGVLIGSKLAESAFVFIIAQVCGAYHWNSFATARVSSEVNGSQPHLISPPCATQRDSVGKDHGYPHYTTIFLIKC